MRGYLSILTAAAVTIAGAVASFTPAQAAGPRLAPAVSIESAGGVELVHRRYRGDRRSYRRGYAPYVYYTPRRYYRPHVYYGYPRYYSRPGVSFQFSFGGGSKHYRGW